MDNHVVADGTCLVAMNDGHDGRASAMGGERNGRMMSGEIMSGLASHGCTCLNFNGGLQV